MSEQELDAGSSTRPRSALRRARSRASRGGVMAAFFILMRDGGLPHGAGAGSRSSPGADPGDRTTVRSGSLFARWMENHRTQRRLERCALADPRLARDIGLTPGEIAMACRARAWVSVLILQRRQSVQQTSVTGANWTSRHGRQA